MITTLAPSTTTKEVSECRHTLVRAISNYLRGCEEFRRADDGGHERGGVGEMGVGGEEALRGVGAFSGLFAQDSSSPMTQFPRSNRNSFVARATQNFRSRLHRLYPPLLPRPPLQSASLVFFCGTPTCQPLIQGCRRVEYGDLKRMSRSRRECMPQRSTAPRGRLPAQTCARATSYRQ